MRRKTNAFTLIELLVVITIIVVLISLLAPALDKAIYQAELAVCASNQHGIATGALGYATESQRRYPFRPVLNSIQANSGIGYNRPDLIRASLDDRPSLRRNIPLKLLVDPMVLKIDLEPEATASSSQIHASVSLWFGMRYNSVGGGKGMFRIGDRLEWQGESFSLLASDYDQVIPDISGVWGTHPDNQQVMATERIQNGSFTLSRWFKGGNMRRGAIDMNFAYDDGSVRRFDGVRWNEWELDMRMTPVPMSDLDRVDFPASYLQVPRQ